MIIVKIGSYFFVASIIGIFVSVIINAFANLVVNTSVNIIGRLDNVSFVGHGVGLFKTLGYMILSIIVEAASIIAVMASAVITAVVFCFFIAVCGSWRLTFLLFLLLSLPVCIFVTIRFSQHRKKKEINRSRESLLQADDQLDSKGTC